MVNDPVPDGFQLLGLDEVEPETEEADRYRTVIDDETLTVLRRATRLGLAVGDVAHLDVAGDRGADRAWYDIPLICVVHAHPDTDVRWARLAIDLAVTAGAIIEDMAPADVDGERPVEIETTVGLELKFATLANVVDVELNPTLARKRTIYFPRISAAGTGFNKAYWDFHAGDRAFLHANRELRLLVSAAKGARVDSAITLRAKVAPRGIAGVIPFFTKLGGVDAVHRLA